MFLSLMPQGTLSDPDMKYDIRTLHKCLCIKHLILVFSTLSFFYTLSYIGINKASIDMCTGIKLYFTIEILEVHAFSWQLKQLKEMLQFDKFIIC